jgi:2-polyprenyl-6-methoxyphenol hydroxylase-like FAD-dependent oxidoreductase
LLESLSHELPEDLVQTVYDKAIISVEEMLENVSITCSDGSVLFGSLVVGADGYRSVVQGKISKCDQSDNLPALNSCE